MLYVQQRCVECNGDFATCATRPGTVDGPGVDNTDLIIYVSSDCSSPDISSGVLAFASACELESVLDRLFVNEQDINLCCLTLFWK